jgi:hypothetical protein
VASRLKHSPACSQHGELGADSSESISMNDSVEASRAEGEVCAAGPSE